MRRQRTSFSSEFKMQVVIESFNTSLTIDQLAQKYTISVKNIFNWRQHFLQNASLAFNPTSSYNQVEHLKQENEKLEKLLMKLTLERNDAVNKLKNLDISMKKKLIETSGSTLSIVQQCKIIGLNRPSLYYAPKPTKKNDDAIKERIYTIFKTATTSYGYRTMHQQLTKEGYKIGVNKVHKLIKMIEEEKGIQQPSKATKLKSQAPYTHFLHNLELANPS